jgi:moderate conductance mechanosensitive channel
VLQNIIAALGSVTAVVALRIVVLLVVTWLGFRFIRIGKNLFEKRVVEKAEDPSRRARLATLLDATVRTLQLLLLFAVCMMALMVVGIDIGPMIAAAGVAGLAISLGAQTLIKDFIGGVLILLEDQFRVGDVVRVQSTEGTVERMSLRASYLRDGDGRLWIVPNGEVRIASNATRDWARAVVELNLSLTADITRAVIVLKAAMEQVSQLPELKDQLLEFPIVEGYTGINDWGVQVRLKAMVKPGHQWMAARLLREHGIAALRAAGIPLASRVGARGDLVE